MSDAKVTASEKLKIMKTKFHGFILTAAVIASSLIASKGYSQVFVGAHIAIHVPVPHVYIGATYAAPAPAVYAPAPAYAGGYYAAPAECEAEFPGYAYYDYPAWGGHYRDRVYFEHYRPFFYRDHAAYFYHGGFDHARWGRDHGDWGHDRGGYGGYHGRRW